MNTKQIEIPLGKRINHSYGMVLGVDDFTQEFAYLSQRVQFLAREMIGLGTVCGLQVSTSSDETGLESILVNPGIAIDPRGNAIYIFSAIQCPPPEEEQRVYLVLYWAERETDPVPLPGSEDGAEKMVPSRIEEYAILKYETDKKAAKQTGVILARLKKTRRKWKIDKEFRVRRRKVRAGL